MMIPHFSFFRDRIWFDFQVYYDDLNPYQQCIQFRKHILREELFPMLYFCRTQKRELVNKVTSSTRKGIISTA